MKTYNKKTSFMVAVFPGLSLKDRVGCEVRSMLPTRRLHSTSKSLVVALLVTCITTTPNKKRRNNKIQALGPVDIGSWNIEHQHGKTREI